VTGLDLGSSALKAVRVGRRKGRRVLLRAARVALPEDARSGWTPECVAGSLPELGGGRRGWGDAVVGLSGKEVMLRYIHLPPAGPEKIRLMMNYEVAEIAGKSGGDVTCDYRTVELPKGLSGENTLVVGYAREESVVSLIDALKAGGVGTRFICPTCIGLFNAMAHLGQWGDGETLMLLDIGSERLSIAVGGERVFYFARIVGPGGRTFTEAVAERLKVDLATAESMKRKIGAVGPVEEDASPQRRQVGTALEEAAGEVLSVVRSSILFCRAQTRLQDLSPSRILVTGGASALRGFPEWLSTKLDKPVETFHPAALMDASGLPPAERAWVEEAPGEATAAIGLALAGEGPPSFALDLLPNAMKQRRRFRARTVYLWMAGVAAAAAAVLLLVGALLSNGKARRLAGERAEMLGEIQGRQKAYGRLKKEAEELRGQTAALSGEGFGNRLALEVMGVLIRATPAAVEIGHVDVARTVERKKKKRKSEEVYDVVVKGVVHPSEKDVFQVLGSFRERLLTACPSFVLTGGARESKPDAEGRLVFELRLRAALKRERG
jgi:Tfp pilus assembly PilM family ATPase